MNYTIMRTSPDELKHFGIKGQKWGIRRYQNADGTLTEEGKARYYTDSEKRNLANAAKNSMYSGKRTSYYPDKEDARVGEVSRQLKAHPVIQDSARKVSEEIKAYKEAEKVYWDEVDKFYKNKDVYEKYLNMAVNHFMKEVGPNWGTREQAYNWFKYDDGDQGSHSSLDLYERSPEGKKLKDARKAESDSYMKFSDSCKKYVSDYIGEYGNEIVNPGSSYERTVESRLSDFVMQVAESNYDNHR